MHLNSLKISHRFATLFGLVALVVALSAAWSFTVFHEFIAKGSAHERLAQGRELVADMAVPGQHIIESYLLCLQLAGTANVAQREEMVERLLILQREYDARYAWWASLPLPDALGSAHLAQARTPTVAFYRTAFNDFVPALRHGDEKTAGQSLERLKALYETHRIAAGRVEQIARKHNESLSADFEVRIRWTAMFLSLALLACLAAGLKGVAMIRDSIAPLLADAARLATTIASGDIRARWLHDAKHDFGELGTALNKMAETLEGRAEALKNNAAEMERRATHDHLTGFPNRGLLEERLYHSMRQAQRQKRRLMVLSIDLDNLKLVNDSLGHNTGDELLSHVAHRMAACIRGADTIARLGGDEFVILFFLEDSASDDSIIPMLHRLLDAIAKPWQLGGYEIRVSCSIGVARYPGDGEDVQTLLRNADAAMYRAKELGRNNFQFYTSELNGRVRERLVLEEGLRQAISREELLLLYQPQVNTQSGHIIGVEALLRWKPTGLGVIAPATFIPLAEEAGLIALIGDWVMHTACKQNKAWQDAGLPPIVISVNVSARQFRDKDLPLKVEQALQQSGLGADYLELELTESVIMEDVEQASATMRKLRAMGVRLSVDDFGTGYSSLSALKSFPVTRLKIDRSFIGNIPDDKAGEAIVATVIALGHRLQMRVIAEGVETESQMVFLRDHMCDEIQGFYFSKPVAAGDFEALMQAQAQVAKLLQK